MMEKTKRLSLVVFILMTLVFGESQLFAQEKDSLYFFIDLPLLEHPFNTNHKYRTTSMQQSIKLSKSFYYSVHYGLGVLGKKKLGKKGGFWSKVLMTIFDFAPVPFSNTWLHEEWHRTILSLNNAESQNSYWSNSVKKVDDEDLVHLKLISPQDMVREATAGNEGNLEFVYALEKDVFFNQVNTWNYGLYWGNYMVNSFYLFGSTQKDSKLLVDFKNSEDEHVHDRDVNGFDPINAVYDLFNPNRPYEDRGIHPSGVGIDRYIEFNDLSTEAKRFLKNQFSLSLLNFLDLNLFGIDEFGKKTKFNLSIRHHMTSFGYMVAGNIFFKTNQYGGIIRPKFYKNNERAFLGIDLELRNNWGMIRLAGWQQPENQLFNDANAKLGGLIAARISPYFKNDVFPYAEFTLKSSGWVAGNPYLRENFSFLLGLSMRFREKH